MELTLTTQAQVVSTVERHFVRAADGWFYPRTGQPLVRVLVLEDRYRVQRRRRPNTAWMPIVSADLAEFSANSFGDWASTWKLAA